MNKKINEVISSDYKYGFSTNIKQNDIGLGLNKETVIRLSKFKKEPKELTDWRIKSYEKWLKMKEPKWSHLNYTSIDYQNITYHTSHNKDNNRPKNLSEVDPEILNTYEKLGVPLQEQKILSGVAVDAVFDSVSVFTTFKKQLSDLGIIFCSMSEAIEKYFPLVKRYLGSVVPSGDNYFSALNSAVFSDGSFVYIPEGVRCPVDLSTYFRINSINSGQFERTLIIADKNSYVSYLEGCSAPLQDKNQLHAAVVELIALEGSNIKYSTVQNWYPGDKNGKGGIYNFVTKRGLCKEDNSHISWTQIEVGSSVTWKYPSVILKGNNSTGSFYSVALTKHFQQADTGTKMIHIGKNTRSTIISKGISACNSKNSYRGLVRVLPSATNSRNFSQCDSLIIGNDCSANTYPYIENFSDSSQIEHEATTSKISDDQLFYCRQRGISLENSIMIIVNGFCKDVFKKLPLEFAVESQKLMEVTLEGAVG